MSFRRAAREELPKTLQVLKIAAEPVTPVPTHLNAFTYWIVGIVATCVIKFNYLL